MSSSTTPAEDFSLTSTIKLNNGVHMPRIHLGVYCTSGSETRQAVTHALQAGYRAIDSAEWYANEGEVGSAISSFLSSQSSSSSPAQDKEEGLKREDLWFTTKLKDNRGYDETRRRIKESIKKSGLGYLDLYLLHSPYGGRERRKECWRGVEDAIADGEVRVGGVSNFGVKHLQELLSTARTPPSINQIEIHPFNTQTAITTFCHKHNITLQAYAPLARGMRFKHPTIVEMSRKYNVSPAQLMIKWSLQKGYVPLPKSVKRNRIEENARVEGWRIEEGDMKKLDGCDEGLVTDWDPTDAD